MTPTYKSRSVERHNFQLLIQRSHVPNPVIICQPQQVASRRKGDALDHGESNRRLPECPIVIPSYTNCQTQLF
ncbi:hypothetical protein DPMN_027573 [Dreissena polymorpha]|uniref:Uncharacterized protein n=1 Tax=Dreissena polymorpha TaxID=45954 RepID=A0A9D4RDS0_DREPO|nr:hypothetical protein DPMN_027573 [Dreissena polymorpha]